MIKVFLARWIAKKGGVFVLLMIGDLIVKTTKSKKDNKLWNKIRPIIIKYK